MKLYGFKPLKHRRASTTNLQRRRTQEEHEEPEEQRISNKLIAKDSLSFLSKIFDPFLNQIEGFFVFESKSHYHNSNQ